MCLTDDCGEVSEGRRSFLGGALRTLAASALASRVLGRQQQPPPKPAEPLEPLALGDPNIVQGDVTFRSGGAEIRGHLARPKAPGRHPAVVVLWPNPGVTDDPRNTAAQLAQGGFVGLAFDAYSRDPGLTANQARARFEYFGGKEFDELQRRDAAAAVAYLRRQPFCERGPVGLVGFCGSARQALVYSTTAPAEVAAVVAFYGPPVLGASYQSPRGAFKLDIMHVLDRIRVPVQCHYGTADPVIPLADVDRLERDLKAQGTPSEVFRYEGAAHAFYDFTRPRFDPAAAKLAHARMIQFLRKHLRRGEAAGGAG
ncbi:MAG TPA: dienelactone hydrolase family protein [Pyrinomonadaceae bacterium]|jgi:carboxymethylenebutenolidase